MDMQMIENYEFKLNAITALKTPIISDPTGTSTITLTNDSIDISATSVNMNGKDISNDIEQLDLLTDKIVPAGVRDDWVTTTTSVINSQTIYALDKATFVYSGSSNFVYYSLDQGVTILLSDMTNVGRMHVAYGNGLFVACGVDDPECFTSTNGINWTEQGILPFQCLTSPATYFNGLFVFSTNLPGQRAARSVDGTSWFLSSLTYIPYNFAQNDNILVAVGGNGTSYTLDGITWVETIITDHCRGVCWDSNKKRFLSLSRVFIGRVYTSSNGIDWDFTDGFGIDVNFLLYVPEYQMYYIGRDNVITGGYGLEYSKDPVTVPFKTRALHYPDGQGPIYDIGYMEDTKQFWIDSNTNKWNYSLVGDQMGVTDDFVCDNMSALTINHLTPNSGVYSGLSQGLTINSAAGIETLVSVTGTGSLTIPANKTIIGDAYTMVSKGFISTGDVANDVQLTLFFGGVLLAAVQLPMENMVGVPYKVKINTTFRSLTQAITCIDFTYNKSATKSFVGLREIGTGVVDCSVDNDFDLRAEIINVGVTTLRSEITTISKIY